MKCDKCVGDKENCVKCLYNPAYGDLTDRFEPYKTNCPLQEYYCLCDPAYQYYKDKAQFKKDYGDIDPLSIKCWKGRPYIIGDTCFSGYRDC